jgi:hypothetical protein
MPKPDLQRELAKPRAGTYVIRMAKRGPLVPVRLERRAGRWLATAGGGRWVIAGGQWAAARDGWPEAEGFTEGEIEALAALWLMGDWHPIISVLTARPVGEGEYRRLVELLETMPAWHPCHRPTEPMVGKRIRELRMQGESDQ